MPTTGVTLGHGPSGARQVPGRAGQGGRSATFGSLVMGIPGSDGLRNIGRVGLGFDAKSLDDLQRRLDRRARTTTPRVDLLREDARTPAGCGPTWSARCAPPAPGPAAGP